MQQQRFSYIINSSIILHSNITNLAAASVDSNTDSIVDQNNDVVLAGDPNHSFLSPQKLQCEVINDDLDDDSNDSNDDNDNDNANDNNDDNNNHLGMEYNAVIAVII